jgi:hypothetical protein
MSHLGQVDGNGVEVASVDLSQGSALLRNNSGSFATFAAIRRASSQFCLFEGGQLLRVSGDCEGPHAGSHSENLSASRNFDARGSYALRGRRRRILVGRLT